MLSRRLQRTMREVVVHVGCVREALALAGGTPATGPATAGAGGLYGPTAFATPHKDWSWPGGAGHLGGWEGAPVGGVGGGGATATCLLLGQQVRSVVFCG